MRRLKPGHLWLAAFGCVFAGLSLVYRDGSQQDSGYHFLYARWGWAHPDMFVRVWARPLFTFLYAFPALLGYPAAKLLSVALALGTGWLTVRVAEHQGFRTPWAVVPLLFLQPATFMLAFDTLTETLFAFLLAAALLCRVRGRFVAAALLVSLLPCVRPEGWFIGVLWGAMMVVERRAACAALLATGTLAWWLAALAITGDPLYIVHNWPVNWTGDTPYLVGLSPLERLLNYVGRLPLIAGPLLLLLLPVGLWRSLRERRRLAPALLGFFFVLHTILWAAGTMGTAGYERYFVCVSAPLALVLLEAWERLEPGLGRLRYGVIGLATGLSALFCFHYVDAHRYARDFRAVEGAGVYLRDHPVPIERLVWSLPYMPILLGRDPVEREPIYPDAERTLASLRESPRGTLVFWDGQAGVLNHGVGPDDFERIGYRKLFFRTYTLEGYIFGRDPLGFGGPRRQTVSLHYKD